VRSQGPRRLECGDDVCRSAGSADAKKNSGCLSVGPGFPAEDRVGRIVVGPHRGHSRIRIGSHDIQDLRSKKKRPTSSPMMCIPSQAEPPASHTRSGLHASRADTMIDGVRSPLFTRGLSGRLQKAGRFVQVAVQGDSDLHSYMIPVAPVRMRNRCRDDARSARVNIVAWCLNCERAFSDGAGAFSLIGVLTCALCWSLQRLTRGSRGPSAS
jgi:hypothetical protein